MSVITELQYDNVHLQNVYIIWLHSVVGDQHRMKKGVCSSLQLIYVSTKVM